MKGKFAWGGGGKESGVRSKESEDRSQEGRGGIVIPAPRVIPAKAGNQTLRVMPVFLGSGFRRNDDTYCLLTPDSLLLAPVCSNSRRHCTGTSLKCGSFCRSRQARICSYR